MNDSGHLGELIPSWKVDDPELDCKLNHNAQLLYVKGNVWEMILNILRIQEKNQETFFIFS